MTTRAKEKLEKEKAKTVKVSSFMKKMAIDLRFDFSGPPKKAGIGVIGVRRLGIGDSNDADATIVINTKPNVEYTVTVTSSGQKTRKLQFD